MNICALLNMIFMFVLLPIYTNLCVAEEQIVRIKTQSEIIKQNEPSSLDVGAPDGWSIWKLDGENGLKTIFWPEDQNFNSAETMVFVFMQDRNSERNREALNLELFNKKCPEMKLKKLPEKYITDSSSYSEYFSGKCGVTSYLAHVDGGQYSFLILVASSKTIFSSEDKKIREIINVYQRIASDSSALFCEEKKPDSSKKSSSIEKKFKIN